MCEILTADELAQLLRLSKRSVYELTKERVRASQQNPIPFLKINGNVRFRKSDVEAWLARVAEEAVAA